MSSLATAPAGAAPVDPRAAHSPRVLRLRGTPDLQTGITLAALLGLLAFLTTAGVSLQPNTWAEIVLVLAGGTLGVVALLRCGPGPRWGGITLLVFGGLGALTAASISWSVQPANSWLESNRTVSYVAVFAGAIALARLIGDRWRALVGAIAVLAGGLSAYALLVKVFPGALDRVDSIGRVHAPFDYSNAAGVIAAMGLPATVWAGARRDRGRLLRALAVPTVAVLVTVVMLSLSRSALLAALLGLLLWFTLVPLRLRGALVLALGSAGGAAASVWGLHTHAIIGDRIVLSARVEGGHGFGVVVGVVLLVTVVAGILAAFLMDTVWFSQRARRSAGIALITVVTLVPLGGLGALAGSSRGLTGEISHAWSTLTDPHGVVKNTPGRLVDLSNSRARYWNEGMKVGEHHPLIGAGAGAYGTARTRYTDDPLLVEHAHSYPVETFADLGAIGLGASLALLIAWTLATARTFGPKRRRGQAGEEKGFARPDLDQHERIGLLTLLCVVVTFGVHSTIDWTWFIPGTAVPALLCAGWLAGRGPLTQRIERREAARSLARQPGLAVGVSVAIALGLLAGWVIWQPLGSAQADSAAIAALEHGDSAAALAHARTAVARDPLSAEPLWELAAVLSAVGDQHGAHAQFVQAIALQPENPATWRELGFYDLAHGQPHKALGVLHRSLALDPTDAPTLAAVRAADRALRTVSAP